MKKLLIGMLLLGGVIAVITLVARRRSASEVDEWDSFAGDMYGQATESVSKAIDTATDSVSKAADVAKESVAQAADEVQTSASKAAEAAKKA